MKLDPKKTERQKLCFSHILDAYANPAIVNNVPIKAGIIQAVTGFGKTFIAVMAIKDMNERHPDRTTLVVVPTTKLKNDWTGFHRTNDDGTKRWVPGHIEIHGLLEVEVYVVNTYVKYTGGWVCDLLILDEIHHYGGIDAVFFSSVIGITKYRFGIGLSATLTPKQVEFLGDLGWRVVDTIDEEEAEREGYTSNSVIFNLAIPLTPADIQFNEEVNLSFKSYFSKFDHQFDLVKACNVGNNIRVAVKFRGWTSYVTKTGGEWREWWAKQKNWDGTSSHTFSPANLSKYAAQAMYLMRKRKDMWQNRSSKLEYIKQLVEKFKGIKTMTFSETSEFADKISALFPGKALSYHSNLSTLAVHADGTIITDPPVANRKALKAKGFIIKSKVTLQKEAIAKFEDPNSGIDNINTVRALDEGFDVKKVGFILQVAYSSTERQDTQRNGRGKRIDYDNLDKKTLIVNLYMEGTQEEKWLRSKQAGKRFVRWVKSVDEISLNQTITFGTPTKTKVPITEL